MAHHLPSRRTGALVALALLVAAAVVAAALAARWMDLRTPHTTLTPSLPRIETPEAPPPLPVPPALSW